jgi:TPP-dependent pyruvate/acetoin dehydrogenase alpha subunit
MTGLDLVAAYRGMLTIREFENHAAQLRARGTIVCSLHLCNGQEAIAIGARAALSSGDAVTATYRGHHWAIACGTPLEALYGEFMGRESGINGGRGGAGFVADPDRGFLGENGIVGAGVPIGVGAALAARYDGSGRVALAAFGDGALNQGAVHEAMNFAGVFSLPVVFVCENNGYAEYTPTAAMFPIQNLHERANAYGFLGMTVDGADPQAVHEAVRDAVDRARSGGGPTLVVAEARRLEGHHTHDAEQYRPENEKDVWAESDPIPVLRRVLLESRLADADTLASVDRVAREDVRIAAEAAASSPPADPETVIQHVYG